MKSIRWVTLAAMLAAFAGGAAAQQYVYPAKGQQQASQQTQAGQQAYQKARGACLEGKGYTVK